MIPQSKTVLVPSGSGPAVVTPRLWGGYELPAIAGIRPVYHPALNQVWIERSSLPEAQLTLALAHEAVHAQSIGLQPAQLIPLRAELLGYVDRPNERCFDDIVETVCEASVWGLTRLGMKDIESMVSVAKYPDLFATLLELAKRLAAEGQGDGEDATRLKEAVMGLCLLLMHIVPYRPRLGPTILQRLGQFPILPSWQERYQVFLYYYAELQKEWEQNTQRQEQMTLVLPMEIHRGIDDMVLFLSAALQVVHSRSETFTAVFPTLLLLVTQATFVLLPIISLGKTGRRYGAKIQVVHSTSKSRQAPNRALDLQRRIEAEAKDHGVVCSASPIFLALVEVSQRFASSNKPNRIPECFQAILQMLPHLLKRHLTSRANCERCKQIFQGDVFDSALATVMGMSRADYRAAVRAASNYQEFLLKDMPHIIQETWGLPELPQASRRYRFL
jgi:hypothetical protein